MQVKRFVAPTMREALQQVRDDIGPEAVILSNRKVQGGVEILTLPEGAAPEPSPKPSLTAQRPFTSVLDAEPLLDQRPVARPAAPSKLELELDRMQREARQRASELAARFARAPSSIDSAAADGEASVVQLSRAATARAAVAPTNTAFAPPVRPSPMQSSSVQPSSVQTSSLRPSLQAAPLADASGAQVSAAARSTRDDLAALREEMQGMRELLSQQLAGMAWQQCRGLEPEKASSWRRLKRLGLDNACAQRLLNTVDTKLPARQQWLALMSALSRALLVDDSDPVMAGGVFALVGPAGAGKTTSLAKLATRYVLTHGAGDIAIVSLDSFRIGASDQLRTVGRILNVPVRQVDAGNPLERVLFSLRHKKLILIDTAGLGASDPQLARQMQQLNEVSAQINTLLVLPASSQAGALRAAFANYRTDYRSGCIVSKLDEADCLGPLLSLLIEQRLPLAYCASGQAIPDDLAVADARTLVRQAIALAQAAHVDEGELAETWAASRH